MLLRPTRLEDVRDLAMVEALCFPYERWSLEQLRDSLSLQTTYGWEVVEEGAVVAFILVQRAGMESEILTLAVHPDYRRRGFGRNLVQKVLDSSGAQTVFLEVAADNLAANGLYEACGFKQFGVRKGYYRRAGGNVDALTYRFEA